MAKLKLGRHSGNRMGREVLRKKDVVYIIVAEYEEDKSQVNVKKKQADVEKRHVNVLSSNDEGDSSDKESEDTMLGNGGGVCIHSLGLILTTAHLIPENTKNIYVMSRDDNDVYNAIVLDRKPAIDLCLLLIVPGKGQKKKFQYINIRDTKVRIREGDDLFSWVHKENEFSYSLFKGHTSYPFEDPPLPEPPFDLTYADDIPTYSDVLDKAFYYYMPYRTLASITKAGDTKMHKYHPHLPLIETHSFRISSGTSGCPVFKTANCRIIGIFAFSVHDRDYVIPLSLIKYYIINTFESFDKLDELLRDLRNPPTNRSQGGEKRKSKRKDRGEGECVQIRTSIRPRQEKTNHTDNVSFEIIGPEELDFRMKDTEELDFAGIDYEVSDLENTFKQDEQDLGDMVRNHLVSSGSEQSVSGECTDLGNAIAVIEVDNEYERFLHTSVMYETYKINPCDIAAHIKLRKDMEMNDIAMAHVLPFLPAKSLVRLRSVSKECNKWIANPFLAHSRCFLVFSRLFCQYRICHFFVALNQSANGIPSSAFGFLPQSINIKSSCNRLLLFQGAEDKSVNYVCISANEEYHELPHSSYYHGEEPRFLLAFEPSVLNLGEDYKYERFLHMSVMHDTYENNLSCDVVANIKLRKDMEIKDIPMPGTVGPQLLIAFTSYEVAVRHYNWKYFPHHFSPLYMSGSHFSVIVIKVFCFKQLLKMTANESQVHNELLADCLTSVLEDEDICKEKPGLKLEEDVLLDVKIRDISLISSDMVAEEEKLLEESAKEEDEPKEATPLNESQFTKLDELFTQTQLYLEFLLEKMDYITKNGLEEYNKDYITPKRGRGSKRKAATSYNTRKATRPVTAMLTKSIENTDSEDLSIKKEQAELVPTLGGGNLKPYQMKGVKWMISLWQNGLDGILADQMGLGKTIQITGFLAHLKGKGLVGPYLVIAPLFTLSNWVNEISRFMPSMRAIIYHEDKKTRDELRKKQLPITIGPHFPIVVTSYEVTVYVAKKHLKHYNWKYIVVDEVHRLKNSKCILVRELEHLPVENKLLLTGTPLQNNLAELWSLLNFILPDIFSSREEFGSWFDLTGKCNKKSGKEELEEIRRAQVQLGITVHKYHSFAWTPGEHSEL